MVKYLQINQYQAEYTIQNIVMTKGFKNIDRIDLVAVASHNKDVEYNPERFSGAKIQVGNPKGTMLLFSTGKYVIAGLRTEADGEKIVKKVIEYLDRAKIKVSEFELQVANIVLSGKLADGLNLNKAAVELDNCIYEPEIFPGLVYRVNGIRPTFLLFSSGAFVCAGAKEESEIEPCIRHVRERIEELHLTFQGNEEFENESEESESEDFF